MVPRRHPHPPSLDHRHRNLRPLQHHHLQPAPPPHPHHHPPRRRHPLHPAPGHPPHLRLPNPLPAHPSTHKTLRPRLLPPHLLLQQPPGDTNTGNHPPATAQTEKPNPQEDNPAFGVDFVDNNPADRPLCPPMPPRSWSILWAAATAMFLLRTATPLFRGGACVA